MNTPPPPGYYNAPPPPKNSNSGCFKAAGITCGVLLVLMIIGGVLIGNFVKNQMKNPTGIFGQFAKIGTSTANGVEIQQAITQYKAKNGNYPQTLTALVPNYIDGKKLHSDLDVNPSPGHISWKYVRPNANPEPKTPMLILPYTMQIQNKTVPSQIIINVDGSTNASSGQTGGYEQTPSAQ